jgi:hypothetical protein
LISAGADGLVDQLAAGSDAAAPSKAGCLMRERKQLTAKDALRLIAHHEAGHAVAYIRAQQKMGRHWPAFDQVLIRPEALTRPDIPYIDLRGREVLCCGLVEKADLYSLVSGRLVWDGMPDMRPTLQAAMEWEIMGSLAGPYAEVVARGRGAKSTIFLDALFSGGVKEDFKRAEDVLADWKWATKGRAGLRRFGERTRELVLADWPAIEALAAALLTRNVLSYDEAVDAAGLRGAIIPWSDGSAQAGGSSS